MCNNNKHNYLDLYDSISNSGLIGSPMLSFYDEEHNIALSYYFDNHALVFDYNGTDSSKEKEYNDIWDKYEAVILITLNEYKYQPTFTDCECSRQDENNRLDANYFIKAYEVINETFAAYINALSLF